MDHEIFQTPNSITPTLTSQPTPTEYFASSEGAGLDMYMPMWRVQTEGYLDGTDAMIGMVSRSRGFLDSPDTEAISRGVNTKSVNGIAIGRHANFMLWGFAASPTYLTEEAKLVLVNSLHYIAKFDGQTVVGPKRAGTVLRDNLEQKIQALSAEGWSTRQAEVPKLEAALEQRRASVKNRIAANDPVTPAERRLLDHPGLAQPNRFRSVRSFFSKNHWASLQEDPKLISAYLNKNAAYFRPVDWYKLEVDVELKQLGLANNAPDFLNRVTALFADPSPDQTKLALTLLERYTAESFEAPDDWIHWLQENRSRLFFSESAGYKWLVNRRQIAPSLKLNPTPRLPLDWQTSIRKLRNQWSPDQGSELEVTVHIEILDGWHTYDTVPANQPYSSMQLHLELPDGVSMQSDWKRPASHQSAQVKGLQLWTGPLQFQATLLANPDIDTDLEEIRCNLQYQACNDELCLPKKLETKSLTWQ